MKGILPLYCPPIVALPLTFHSTHTCWGLWHSSTPFGTATFAPRARCTNAITKELHVSDYCQTLTLPKPLVEFANRPMILHQIESLAAAGVTDIVLAVNYRPDIMAKALKRVCTSHKNKGMLGGLT